jgi:hypothetical protein
MKKWLLGACGLIVLVMIVLSLCLRKDPPAQIVVKLLPAPNPTVYIFDRTVDEVDAALAKYRDDSLGPLYMADNPVSPDEVAIFAQAGNEHDAYLDSGDANATASKIYFFPDGKPCGYGAGMHIHVTRIDASHTKVAVFVHKPWIFVGERKRYLFPLGMHDRSIFVKVVPTTVEEYSLLRKLGLAMGVSSMPPLIPPSATSGVKQFQYTDGDVINLPGDRRPLDWAVPSTLAR